MVQKIQLKHPAGKRTVRFDKDEYDTIKKFLLNSLKKNELTHTEILQAINDNFRKNKIQFKGSLGWYVEWVKLDLEAGKIIERITNQSPQKFRLSK